MKASEDYIRACQSTADEGSDTESEPEPLGHEEIRAALLEQTGTISSVMPPARKDYISLSQSHV